MSLSNMRNDPRQEIKETAIGLLAIFVFAIITYVLANYVIIIEMNNDPIGSKVLSYALAGFASVGIMFSPAFIHFIGEEITEALDL